jgi:SP family sugar:H+ symporter-like MFS transporter
MATGFVGTSDLSLIEAPVTWRAYLICGFASFGGKSQVPLAAHD